MSSKENQFYGYTVLKHITENTRFATYQVEKDQKQYFLKCAKAGLERNLSNDVWWSMTLNRIVEGKPEIDIRAPQVVRFEYNWVLFEWVEGKELATPDIQDSDIVRLVPYISNVLFGLDQTIRVAISESPFVEPSDSAPYTMLDTKWPQWTKKPLEQGFLTQGHIDKSKTLLDDWAQYVQAGLAHGDFSPWHILVNDKEKVLIDGDHSSIVKPRYYDLAYIYSRLYSRNHARASVAQLLKDFMKKSPIDKDAFAKAFLPVLTSRAIGVCNDASHDYESSGNDYRASALELLDNCLSRDIDNLL